MLGLRLNSCKTVEIVCWPCLMVVVRVDKYYNWRMMGEGRIFMEWQWEWVSCRECGKDMAKGSLVTHCQTHEGMVKWKFGSEVDESDWGGDKPRTYNMVFLERSSHSKDAVAGRRLRRR